MKPNKRQKLINKVSILNFKTTALMRMQLIVKPLKKANKNNFKISKNKSLLILKRNMMQYNRKGKLWISVRINRSFNLIIHLLIRETALLLMKSYLNCYKRINQNMSPYLILNHFTNKFY